MTWSWPLASCRAWHRKWPRAPSCSSHSTRLLFRRLTAPSAEALASTLNSPPLATATGWGIREPRGVKLQKTTREADWAPQASSTEPPRTPWMEEVSLGAPRVGWGCPGDREATQTIRAGLRSPAPVPCLQSLLLVVCRAGRLVRV